MHISSPWKTSLKLLLPFLLWMGLSGNYIFNFENFSGSETFSLYGTFKFFFNNIRLGEYPLWNPFVMWGAPVSIDLRHIGEFNPFFYLSLFLNGCGLPFYKSFLVTMLLYYFLGLAGFYMLARQILKDEVCAYTCYLLLLFSSFGIKVISVLILVFIYVPAVWFFYFLFAFSERRSRFNFLGMIFSLMVIFTTYLPFYFLLALGSAGVFIAGAYYKQIPEAIRCVNAFFRKNTVFCVLSLVALGISFVPIIQSFYAAQDSEVVAPARQGEAFEGGAYRKGVELTYINTSDGALSARMFFDDLFSDLKNLPYASDIFFYVSIFGLLIVVLGVITRSDRRLFVLSGTTVALFLFSISNAAPVHKFFFEHVYFFRLFRNLHYLVPFLLSAFILTVGDLLRRLLNKETVFHENKIWQTLSITVIHAGAVIFLLSKPDVIVSTYVTVVLSFIFFICCYLWPAFLNRPRTMFLLAVLSLLQPLEIYAHRINVPVVSAYDVVKESYHVPLLRPRFNFERTHKLGSLDEMEAYQLYFKSRWIKFEDSAGFDVPYQYAYPNLWSYYLNLNAREEIVYEYTKYKFYLYTTVKVMDPALTVPNQLAQVNLSEFAAVVEDETSGRAGELLSGFKERNAMNGISLLQEADNFSVTDFSMNKIRIRTNYERDLFLVYNDSYDKLWKGYVNGVEVPVYRANFAFKGMRVPAGENVVEFRYGSKAHEVMMFAILAVFWIVFGVLTVLFVQDFRQREGVLE